MNETDQLKKLMEAIQLNEYLVREGEPVSTVLQLNIFTDAESRLSEYEEFRSSPEWMAIENKYYALAVKLESMVNRSNATLDELGVDAVHRVWYDGSDAYDSVKDAIHFLPQIYDRQIATVQDILKRNR